MTSRKLKKWSENAPKKVNFSKFSYPIPCCVRQNNIQNLAPPLLKSFARPFLPSLMKHLGQRRSWEFSSSGRRLWAISADLVFRSTFLLIFFRSICTFDFITNLTWKKTFTYLLYIKSFKFYKHNFSVNVKEYDRIIQFDFNITQKHESENLHYQI